jgi:hypothetical protein
VYCRLTSINTLGTTFSFLCSNVAHQARQFAAACMGWFGNSEPLYHFVLTETEAGLLVRQSGWIVMVNSYFDHPHASQLGSFLDERKEIPKNASPSVGRQNNGNLDLYLLP